MRNNTTERRAWQYFFVAAIALVTLGGAIGGGIYSGWIAGLFLAGLLMDANELPGNTLPLLTVPLGGVCGAVFGLLAGLGLVGLIFGNRIK
jgi:hypothetical protein